MAFVIVGEADPGGLGIPPRRLAVCENLAAAEAFISTLPDVESGRYYIDPDCTGTLVLEQTKRSFTFADIEVYEAEDALTLRVFEDPSEAFRINLPTMKALRLVEHLVQKIQRVI